MSRVLVTGGASGLGAALVAGSWPAATGCSPTDLSGTDCQGR